MKILRRCTTLFFFSLFLISCDQTGLGIGTAIKNFVTLPYDMVKGHFSNKEYEEVERRTELAHVQKATTSPGSGCPGVNSSLPDDGSNIEVLYTVLRDETCSCVPWGTCEKDLCSCDKLCPNNFDIFDKPPIRDSNLQSLSLDENSLKFRNHEAMNLSNIKGTQGYCWGHASVTSKFNRLAFFKPEETAQKTLLDSPEGTAGREDAIKYYKRAIDKIVDNKVADIPGFKNLNELSTHPELEVYIADRIANSWADNAMSIQGLKTAVSSSPMKREESQDFIYDVVQKIDHKQQPQIVFTEEGNMGRMGKRPYV